MKYLAAPPALTDVRMRCLDRTWPSPAENLACDEALLEACEAEPDVGALRFFEAPRPWVVLGYGNREATEANLEACRQDGVPVLRRMSGGGAVVLGPGCLAYALILPVDAHPDLRSVTGTNRLVMETHRALIERLIGCAVRVQGHTDLTVDDHKFSGNSQRRGRRAVLFHGTFLLAFDLECIARYLPMPTARPEYRRDRGHAGFVTNIPARIQDVKAVLREGWSACGEWDLPIDAAVAHWVQGRYGRMDWHRKR